jgi:hypothetical protein
MGLDVAYLFIHIFPAIVRNLYNYVLKNSHYSPNHIVVDVVVFVCLFNVVVFEVNKYVAV